MASPLRTTGRILAVTATVGVCGSAYLPWWDSHHPVVAIGQTLVPYVSVFALIMAVVCTITALRVVGVLNIISLLAILAVPMASGRSTPACSGTPALTVVAINALDGRANIPELARVVRQHNVDLVLLVESPGSFTRQLREELGDTTLPYATKHPAEIGVHGSAIFSRWPLTPLPEPPTNVSDRHAFEQPIVRVETPHTSFIARAVHPFPPVYQGGAPWSAGMNELIAWQHTITEPLIMGGDFNSGMYHPRFRQLSTAVPDTAASPVSLTSPTWPHGAMVPPFTTLDHILARGFSTTDTFTTTVADTDHVVVGATVVPCTMPHTSKG